MPAIHPRCFPFTAMGTCCELKLYADDESSAARAAGAAIAEVRRIERAYSRYRSDSVVSAINEAGRQGGAICLSPEAADLVDVAYDAYRLSGGLFDVTSGALREVWRDDLAAKPSQSEITRILARVGLHKVAWARPRLSFGRGGMQIDLGGIGKEYAADRAAQVCRELGVRTGSSISAATSWRSAPIPGERLGGSACATRGTRKALSPRCSWSAAASRPAATMSGSGNSTDGDTGTFSIRERVGPFADFPRSPSRPTRACARD